MWQENFSTWIKTLERRKMNISKMIKNLRAHPESRKIGMIATHLGIVRGHSRGGDKVTHVEVVFDHEKIREIVSHAKKLNGIIEVLVDVREGRLKVGDEIMAVAVAGDIRENVFSALIQTVDRLKAEASKKKELFKEGQREKHKGSR
jgi:molybdopterin synthase catalytic subunit